MKMSNKKQILYQADLAKVFGVCVKTFRKNLDTIISNNPNNPRIQRYIGKKWFIARNDLDEFLNLFSKKDQFTSKIHESGQRSFDDEKVKKEYFEEKNAFDAQLELEAEYAADSWLEMQHEIARGK